MTRPGANSRIGKLYFRSASQNVALLRRPGFETRVLDVR